MRPSRVPRRGSGFTYIEVTAAFTVLVIGVIGFAGTVVYTRNLDRTTTTLRKGTAAAQTAIEDVREESAQNWASITSTWDGATVLAQEADNADDRDMDTTVNTDPGLLDSGTGMWAKRKWPPMSRRAASGQRGRTLRPNPTSAAAARTPAISRATSQ